MRVVLEIISGGPRADRRVLCNGQQLVVGRSEWCDLPCPWDKRMSKEHFRIDTIDNQCHIVDLHSSNGTLVNGQPITKVLLRNEDQIKSGSTTFQILMSGDTPVTKTTVIEMSYVEPPSDQKVLAAFRGQLAAEFTAAPVPSGWTKWTGDVEKLPPQVLAELLQKNYPLYLLVDRGRTKIAVAEDLCETVRIFDFLPPAAAQAISPICLPAFGWTGWQKLTAPAWGSDGLIYLFSTQPFEELLSQIRTSCAGPGGSIQGVCWPSILGQMMNLLGADQMPAFAAGCDALIYESPAKPGQWQLFSRHNLTTRLSGYGMKEVRGSKLAQPAQAAAE